MGTVAVTATASGTGKDPSPGGIVGVGGAVALTFRGVPNRTCRVQCAPSVNAAIWHDLGPIKANRTGTMTDDDTPPGNASIRFYRIVYP